MMGNWKCKKIEFSNVCVNDETGTVWTAVAHIVTGVIGSGVLSLAWSIAQLGWIGGPLTIIFFACITLLSSFLLSNTYRGPDPELGPHRSSSYLDAVNLHKGNLQYFAFTIFFFSFCCCLLFSCLATDENWKKWSSSVVSRKLQIFLFCWVEIQITTSPFWMLPHLSRYPFFISHIKPHK